MNVLLQSSNPEGPAPLLQRESSVGEDDWSDQSRPSLLEELKAEHGHKESDDSTDIRVNKEPVVEARDELEEDAKVGDAAAAEMMMKAHDCEEVWRTLQIQEKRRPDTGKNEGSSDAHCSPRWG